MAVLQWILEVERKDITDAELVDSGSFPELDVDLLAALVSIATGDLGRRITLRVDNDAKKGILTKGRQILLMVYHWNRVNEEAGAIYDVTDLMQVQWLGDNNIATFDSNWDSIFAGCGDDIDMKSVKVLYFKHLRKSEVLKADIAYYTRLAATHEDKTYDFLKACVLRTIELQRQDFNREAHAAASKSGGGGADAHLLAAKGGGKGKGKKKGTVAILSTSDNAAFEEGDWYEEGEEEEYQEEEEEEDDEEFDDEEGVDMPAENDF